MADEYDLAAMNRAAQTAGGRVEGGVDTGSSFWERFAGALYDQRGSLLEGVGQYYQTQGYGTYFQSMASELGLKAGSYGMLANWAQIGMVFPQLQQTVIDIQTAILRKQTAEKWLGRVSATRARYAKAGIAIDDRADTPMKAVLTLLESSQEELGWIETDKKVREFNEVFMPGIEAKVKASSATYQKDLMKISQDYSLKNAEIAKDKANLDALATVVGSVGKAVGVGIDE